MMESTSFLRRASMRSIPRSALDASSNWDRSAAAARLNAERETVREGCSSDEFSPPVESVRRGPAVSEESVKTKITLTLDTELLQAGRALPTRKARASL